MKTKIELSAILLMLMVSCEICAYANDSVKIRNYQHFDEVRKEWNMVSSRSDTTVYVEKRFEASKTISQKGGNEKPDTFYTMHSYRTLVPLCSVEYPKDFSGAKRGYILDNGGVIGFRFANNFDITSNDTTTYMPIPKSEAVKELEMLLEDIEWQIEMCQENTRGNELAMEGAKHDSECLYEGIDANGDTILYFDAHIYDFCESIGGADLDFLESMYEDALKYMRKKVSWMFSQKDKPWAGNNLRVKKGLYVIDFLFIKDEPFDLVHKVVDSFELISMPDLDVDKENRRLGKNLNRIESLF